VKAVLEGLRGGLIVSVQAEATSVLNTPEAIALLARCAAANGAVALRIEGTARIAAVRAALPEMPVIGIIKCAYPGFEPYITSKREEIEAVAAAGATIVAFDATARPRAGGMTVPDAIAAVHAASLLAMADCSETGDAWAAVDAGADIVSTTLAGYTQATLGRDLPALELVALISVRHPFAVCEGGVGSPEVVGAAFTAGASAVVVGTAITNVDVLVRKFAAATPRGTPGP
jgi:N-acylglucosamine-6-phosphate 2-epimerase